MAAEKEYRVVWIMKDGPTSRGELVELYEGASTVKYIQKSFPQDRAYLEWCPEEIVGNSPTPQGWTGEETVVTNHVLPGMEPGETLEEYNARVEQNMATMTAQAQSWTAEDMLRREG